MFRVVRLKTLRAILTYILQFIILYTVILYYDLTFNRKNGHTAPIRGNACTGVLINNIDAFAELCLLSSYRFNFTTHCDI